MKPDNTRSRNVRHARPDPRLASLLAAVGMLVSAPGVAALAQDRPPPPGSSRPTPPPGTGPQQDSAHPGVRNPPGTAPRISPRSVITPGGQPVNPGARPGGTNPATNPAAKPPSAHPQTPEPPPVEDGHPLSPDDEITLSAFTDAVELTTLVEYVAKAMGVNVTVSGGLTGSVVFNAPVTIKRHQLLSLLDALLEQQNYTITLDPEGFYIVHPMDKVSFNLGSELPTTKIIPTPNIRPSALKVAIDSQVSGGTGAPGQAQPGVVTASKGFAYIDELGIIVVTDTPRRIAAVEALVNRIIEEYGKAEFTRIELQYIAAPVARARALELVGQGSNSSGQPTIDPNTGMPMPQGQGGQFGPSSKGLDNLGERLTVDPLGNALIFRGQPGEADMLGKFLKIIDAQSTLSPRSYNAGSAAKQVADIARDRGLGQVTLIAAKEQQDPNNPYRGFNFNTGELQPQQNKQNLNGGGPVMVVDEERGTIIYYGTKEQQTELQALIDQFKVEDEFITIVPYKLRHSDATKVAELVLGLIQNTTPVGSSTLLPGSDGSTPGFNGVSQGGARRTGNRGFRGQGSNPSQSGLSISDDERIFVVADKSNNQILVKAPVKDQAGYEKLINKLDQRRPQVYIEAKIVAITADDRLRLAFENQLINANGTGGVLNTNFGLSSFATGAGLTTRKTVATGLSGFTAAIIKSDQVPIVMTALARETNSKIISSPQLLVDDNEEAEVVSLDEQPTTTISRGTSGSGDIVTSGDPASAGTTLTITPQISDGGYLRLKYNIELSNFTGEAQTVGSTVLPPPKQTNKIRSDSITVPGDSTVVVGGLVVDQNTKTIAKVPFIGDIPLLGLLFQDRNTGDRKTTLYIFLTPKIIRDPNFDDLTLLTRGPMKLVGIDDGVPIIKPTFIEIIEPKTEPKAESKSDSNSETNLNPAPPPGG